MKSVKKLESVKNELFAVETPKTVLGGLLDNTAGWEIVNGKKKLVPEQN